ncbi:class A beta-lactamase [Streptomyces sp. NPDC001889]
MVAATALGAGTAQAAPAARAASVRPAPEAVPAGRAAPGRRISRELAALEREYAALLGVYAHNLETGRTVLHRAERRFPMCSVFKTLAAAAVLRDKDAHGEFLARRIHYTEADLLPNSDRCRENLGRGMTVAELCDATIRYSDNTAANLLLAELGGPGAITRFCRSIGDRVTRLDRWEPDLNSAEPWRIEDTSSPLAIGRTYSSLVLGDALNRPDRKLLTGWLLRNTTSGTRFRAGLPEGWTLADKTGGGEYGTNNDVGIAWTPGGAPVVLAVLSTRLEPDAPRVDALIARTAALLAADLGRGPGQTARTVFFASA